ncbi:MAG: Gfo/Idh/MocA family oxidoreductase [Clostridia bacterium]|nr:Gfo/Idh/MocA family oxidoreductase [Clostridia bacterium]
MIKIIFYGFRHGHVNTLYRQAQESPLITVAGCVEEHAQARAKAEQTLGAVFSDVPYAEWLTRDVDAVVIGGAYGDRGAAIIRALEAGKHVISDKPICTTRQELDRIRALTREKGLKLGCMLDLRYLPQTLAAKKILDSGELGQVRNVAFNGQHCINYGSRPGWYFEPGKHGGTINDLSIHGVDLVRMLTGMEFTQIDAARTWNAYADRHPDFKDCATLMARLENGAGVLADISYSAPTQAFSMPSYWEFRVWCQRGMLSFHYTDSTVTVYVDGEEQPRMIPGIPPRQNYLDEWIAEIENDGYAITDNVLRSSEVALRLQEVADREVAL